MSRNICFINTTSTWGGGEKWHFDMALFLKSKGYQVFFCAANGSPLYRRVIESGIPCMPLKTGNMSFLNPFKKARIANFFRQHLIHAVLLNHPSDVKCAGLAAKYAGVKYIIYRRGSAVPVKNSWFNRFLFRHVITHMIANSEATKKTILQNNKNLFPADQIRVIYNGTDCSIPLPQTSVTPANVIVLGNLGRMVEQKGQFFLIDVALHLKKHGIAFKMIIGGDGPLREILKQKTYSTGLSDLIDFPGFINDPIRFMQSIDIFLLPSLWEGFGFVIAEAMACAKPVVAFNISSNPELIQHQQTGFLVEPFNTEHFTQAVLALIHDPALRKNMGETAYQICKSRFSIEVAASRFLDYIETIMQ